MRELDKNKTYDLTELNNKELQQMLDFLRTEYENWLEVSFKDFSEGLENVRLAYGYYGWVWVRNESTANAKELFYTLENVQVDCRDLTREQIKEMTDVFEKNGYEKWMDSDALKIQDNFTYLRIGMRNDFYINGESDNKTAITYEKFMELFGSEESNFNKLVEVLNEELTEEAEGEITLKDLEKTQVNSDVDFYTINKQKPKQYQIGIDTFERCEANMTKEEILACVKFGIDKYTWRNKGQDLEDLEKIIAYANWGIKQLKK